MIAEINERMPRTHGNTLVHIDRVARVRAHRPSAARARPPRRRDGGRDAIGEHVAEAGRRTARRCRWGSARIPDAVLRRLFDKHDLGVHTEMFSDGVVDLVEAGVITNRRKNVHPGRIVTSFVIGIAARVRLRR